MDNTLKGGILYCDRRVYGVERWYIGNPQSADMRIPDEILDSVCFICVLVGDAHGVSEFFIGTGFFVSIPSAIPGKGFHYIVTAKHVIQDAKAAGYSQFFVRLNTHDGSSITAFLPDDWMYPDNPATDVAVIPVQMREPRVKYRANPLPGFATDEVLQEHKVGVGDELFMVGLFSHRWGHQRNIPIVRTGIIASMPDEPFEDDEGDSYDAYLVEMRSIGGLSGSPVYVYLDAWRSIPEKSEFDINNLRWHILLIGVIRGHWDLKRQDAASDAVGSAQASSEIDRLNTGIAQVTPIQEVLAILNREELVKDRQEKEKEALKRHQPTLDAELPNSPSGAERGLTHEGFDEALRRASRKTPSPDEGKGEE